MIDFKSQAISAIDDAISNVRGHRDSLDQGTILWLSNTTTIDALQRLRHELLGSYLPPVEGPKFYNLETYVDMLKKVQVVVVNGKDEQSNNCIS